MYSVLLQKEKKAFPSLSALTKCCGTVQVTCFKRRHLHTMLTLAGGERGPDGLFSKINMYTPFREVFNNFVTICRVNYRSDHLAIEAATQ